MDQNQIQQKRAYGETYSYFLARAQALYRKLNRVPTAYQLQQVARCFAARQARVHGLHTF